MHLCEVGLRLTVQIAGAIFMATLAASGQTPIEAWQYHAPFQKVSRIAVVRDGILALSDYGIMHLEWPDRVLSAHSSVEGLSGVGLTGLAASPDGSFALIGYRDGRIDRWTPDDVQTIDDIPRSGQFQGRTSVNEFAFATANRVFAATAFGVVELDLALNAIRGTYRMRTNSDPTNVVGIAVLGDSLFAATELGLRSASLQDPLYLPTSWQGKGRFNDSILTSLAASHGELAVVSNGKAYRRTATGWNEMPLPSDGMHAERICPCEGRWGVVRPFDVQLYAPDGAAVTSVLSAGYSGNVGFAPNDLACGFTGQDGQSIRWVANPSRGISFFDNSSYAQHRSVAGPLGAEAFDVRWDALRGTTVLTGAVEGPWTPLYLNAGLYRQPAPGAPWRAVTDFSGAKDLLDVLTDPLDSTHWFAASWGGGILEFRDNVFYRRWTVGNSSLRAANGAGPNDVRCGGLAYDSDGALWVTNSLSDVPLHRYDPVNETWQGYSIGALNGQAIRRIARSGNGDLWIQTRTAGVVAVRVVGGVASARRLSAGVGNGNLPSSSIGAFAFDRDGELWVGTASGLGVLYAPENAFTGGNFEAQQLLVEVDGRVQAVLAGQDITAIAVDGGNRKWVGTATAGLFVLAPDGLTQLAHYRIDNSPLPGNRITGLALDEASGYAHIATDFGLFSLRSASVAPSERFNEALLFPNPYRPEFRGMWTITGLVNESYVKVTTADGRRVAEGYASGGQFVWDTMDGNGIAVPSGLYQFWINNPLGGQTTVVQGLLVRP